MQYIGRKTMILKPFTSSSEVNLFESAVHGFAIRGDIQDADERRQKEEVTEKTIKWFNDFLQ